MEPTAVPTSRWLDSPARYGLATRLFHWSIAGLLAWQFAGMAIKLIVGRHPVTAFMVASHKPLGTVLLVLIALRAAWAFVQWRRRPPHPPTLLGRAAAAGHGLLYLLMLYIPGVALLRQYGSGQAFAPWGVALIPGGRTESAWMQVPADASHGLLAWALLAVIAGHAAMVALHRWWWHDDTLARMAGPLGPVRAARSAADGGPAAPPPPA